MSSFIIAILHILKIFNELNKLLALRKSSKLNTRACLTLIHFILRVPRISLYRNEIVISHLPLSLTRAPYTVALKFHPILRSAGGISKYHIVEYHRAKEF